MTKEEHDNLVLRDEIERTKRLWKSDIEASHEIISDYIKENEKYKLIIKALQKHYTDREYYEDNEFLRQLLSVTEDDMVWLKRMAGVDDE